MTQTAMVSNFLQSLQILAKFRVQGRRCKLAVLSILNILLPIQKPIRDFVGTRIAHNVHNSFKLLSTQFTGTAKYMGGIAFASFAF